MVLNRDIASKAAAVPLSQAKDEIFRAFDGPADKIVERLQASVGTGPVIQAIVALIKSGIDNLPALLAALQASGIPLPSWVTLVATLLLAFLKPAPAPTSAT
jgi:hypothetical protein